MNTASTSDHVAVTAPRVGRHQRMLLDQAARAEQQLLEYRLDEECAGLAAEAVRHLRELADLYAIDPTLEDEICNERDRPLSLAQELCRHVAPLARQACRTTALTSSPSLADARTELHLLIDRLRETMVRARAVARPDWASPETSRAISLVRTRQHAETVAELAERVRGELALALALPYSAQEALDLADLADKLAQRARQIAESHS